MGCAGGARPPAEDGPAAAAAAAPTHCIPAPHYKPHNALPLSRPAGCEAGGDGRRGGKCFWAAARCFAEREAVPPERSARRYLLPTAERFLEAVVLTDGFTSYSTSQREIETQEISNLSQYAPENLVQLAFKPKRSIFQGSLKTLGKKLKPVRSVSPAQKVAEAG